MGLGSGFGSNQIFNPTIEQAATPLGQFFVIIAMLYFMTLNGHHVAIVALQKSFSILPVDSILPAFSFEILLRTTAQMILVGVQMAFPIFAALLMADITLALLSRVAPQVQFYFF
jgi:flagellar biosynthetic protein FliR